MKKYPSLAAFYESQPERFHGLLYLIRDTVLATDPRMREVLKYGAAPFFVKKAPICYIGTISEKTGVEVGFPKGYALSNEQGLLDPKGRKVVSGITFSGEQDFLEKWEGFQAVLQEALVLDGIAG